MRKAKSKSDDYYWAPTKSSCSSVIIHQVLLVLQSTNHIAGIRPCENRSNNNNMVYVFYEDLSFENWCLLGE